MKRNESPAKIARLRLRRMKPDCRFHILLKPLALAGSLFVLPQCTTYNEMANETAYMRDVVQPALRNDLSREESRTAGLLNERDRLQSKLANLRRTLDSQKQRGASAAAISQTQRQINVTNARLQKLIGSGR